MSDDTMTIDDVRDEFPEWHFWVGTNQLLYARLPSTSPPVVVSGEDAADLRDMIIKEQWRRGERL